MVGLGGLNGRLTKTEECTGGVGLGGKHHPPKQQHNNHLINVCVCVWGGGGGGGRGSALPVNVIVKKHRFSRSVSYQNLVYFSNNNNNVDLSCAHQRPERSHDTY